MSRSILVVDDEASIRELLELLFSEEGYRVTCVESVGSARRTLAAQGFDLVLCDILMPDGNGLELLREIKELDPRSSVVMMTAYTSTQSAIEAMKLGAYDYLSKPFEVEELKIVVAKAIEKTELVDENVYLRRELEQKYTFENIIGSSPRMLKIFSLVERISRTTSTVLLNGESGTGKELIARAIHFASSRSSRRFLSINCGALPESLLESELFGHTRGAFTGAVRDKKGLFQEANRGTLFLDEVSEMPPPMQVKLLRAIQERMIRRLGSTTEEPVDVRIIAATNRDLLAAVAEGSFREDLYYRIAVIPIDLPPLRDRREDIPLLVNHFLDKHAEAMGLSTRQISLEALRILECYDWPGNVRELENLIERTLALSSGEAITSTDLPRSLHHKGHDPLGPIRLPSEGLDLEIFLTDIRQHLMAEALERSDGVQTRAAQLLGMSFRSFRYYAGKSGLTGDDESIEEA